VTIRIDAYDKISSTPGNGCELINISVRYWKDGYRLPTEAEWEYACRAGTTTDSYWGSNSSSDYAWYDQNSGLTSRPVANRRPNQYGLYDMNGNLFEWCSDWFGEYSTGTVNDPTGLNTSQFKVLRGGSWNTTPSNICSAFRIGNAPNVMGYDVGFRVVLPMMD